MDNLTNKDTFKKTYSFAEGFNEIKKNLDKCVSVEGFSNTNNTILIFIVIISVLLIMLFLKK